MDKRDVGGSVEYPDPIRPAYSLQVAPAVRGLHQRPAVHQESGPEGVGNADLVAVAGQDLLQRGLVAFFPSTQPSAAVGVDVGGALDDKPQPMCGDRGVAVGALSMSPP
ncbi:hypothetical protein ACFRAI_27200 [Streptomyces sp. NPDC056637]|uniref:hypothetical protein n=1 Tax=unclassified Streptomyces TaxID=2593676 RepID=UPI0036776FA4